MTLSRRTLGAFAIFALPLALSACGTGNTEPDMMVRYRTTVEVETPQGVRTGSSVRELNYSANSSGWFPLGESRPTIGVKGEAVAVDIAPGQVLFALLSGARGDVDYAQHVPRIAFPQCVEGLKKLTPQAQKNCQDLKWQAKQIVEFWPTLPKQEWQGADIPLLVRFKNIADPKSVERVEPDALDKAFGPGVKLKRITVQVTDDAVTSGIEGRLKAMGIEKDRNLDNDFVSTTNPTLAQQLGFDDFVVGTK